MLPKLNNQMLAFRINDYLIRCWHYGELSKGANNIARVQKQLRLTDPIFRGVVFDLDGVIVDSHPLHKQDWRSFLAYLGKEVSEADLDFIFEGRKRREILIHFLGELSFSDIQRYGNKKDEFFRQASTDLKPISGTVEFIKDVGQVGLPMAVATSASRQRAHWTLEQLELAECFGVVVPSKIKPVSRF